MPRLPAVKQHTFAAGEISPEFVARTDQERYQQSLSKCQNWLISQTGAAKNCPGSRFIRPVKDQSKRTRLLPYRFSSSQAYVLEFGDLYVRFHREGGTVMSTADSGTHTGSSEAAILTDSGGGWTVNAFVGGTVRNTTDGSSGLITANTATTVTAVLVGGLENDWDASDSYVIEMPYEILSPYSEADLPYLKLREKGDIGILTCRNPETGDSYRPQELRRYDHDEWTLTPFSTASPTSPPTDLLIGSSAESLLEIGEHSGANNQATMTDASNIWGVDQWVGKIIYNTTKSQSATITANTVNNVTGVLSGAADWDTGNDYEIRLTVNTAFDAADATHPAEEWSWVVTAVDAQGNESLPSNAFTANAVLYSDKKKPKLTWNAPTTGNTPVSYFVYRGRDGIFGYLGMSKTTEYIDDASVPDYAETPPEGTDPFREELPPASPLFLAFPTQATPISGDKTTTKTQAIEAFGDRYYVHCFVTLDAGESITLTIRTRPSGGGAYNINVTETIAQAGVSFRYYEVIQDGLGANAEFNIQVSASTGSPEAYADQVFWYESAGGTVDSYPAAATWHEQRLVFGGFSANPQQIKASAVGKYHDFDLRDSALANGSFAWNLAGGLLDEIMSLASQTGLLAFTPSAEWLVKGSGGDPLGPDSVDAKPRTNSGSSYIQPLEVDNAVLFVNDRARSVSQFLWDALQEVGQAREISTFASHLFREYGIEEWAWARYPYRIAWAIRSDGTLLGLTYNREQLIEAWHRRTTTGTFESVASIPEGRESTVYAIVKRTVSGSTKRYVEVFSSREVADAADQLNFLDSALVYDGRNTTVKQIRLTGGTTWAASESMTLAADTASTFIAADVGKQFELTIGASSVRFQVVGFTNGTTLTGYPVEDVPVALRTVYTSTWARCPHSFVGLGHLEGHTVGLLVDGASHPTVTVTGGAFTLGTGIYAATLIAGLPIPDVDLATLPLHFPEDPGTVRTAQKNIMAVSLELDAYRGLYVSHDGVTWEPVQESNVDDSYPTISPENTMVTVKPPSGYARQVNLIVRQTDPLPVTLLSIISSVKTGGNQ